MRRHERGLTPRQLQVLSLMREGNSNPDIADILGITPQSAKNHVEKIMLKLGAINRTEAVIKAIRMGVLSLWPEI